MKEKEEEEEEEEQREEIRKLHQTIKPLKITALCSGVMSRWASASIS